MTLFVSQTWVEHHLGTVPSYYLYRGIQQKRPLSSGHLERCIWLEEFLLILLSGDCKQHEEPHHYLGEFRFIKEILQESLVTFSWFSLSLSVYLVHAIHFVLYYICICLLSLSRLLESKSHYLMVLIISTVAYERKIRESRISVIILQISKEKNILYCN